MKKCTKCNKMKDGCDFYKRRDRPIGLTSQCRECIRIRDINRSKSNKQLPLVKICTKCKIEKSNHNFVKDKYNRSGISDQCKCCRNLSKKEYRKNNKQKERDYKNKRYYTDTEYRLLTNVRNRINSAIKSQKTLKNNRTNYYLGCSIKEYKVYLENLFVDGMSWTNRNLWEIDHIVPCSTFDLSDEAQMLECFHYTNTQPMWKEDNRKKSDKTI